MALIASPPPESSTVLQDSTAQNDFTQYATSRSLQPAGLSRGHVISASTGAQLTTLANGHGARNQQYQSGNQVKSTLNGLSSETHELVRAQTKDQPLAHRSRPQVTRRRTDSDVERQAKVNQTAVVEEAGELRHGWEDQYNSSEFLGLLSSVRSEVILAHT